MADGVESFRSLEKKFPIGGGAGGGFIFTRLIVELFNCRNLV